MRRIGVLMNLAADDPNLQVRSAAFEADLQESSWTVGRNIQIDYRFGAADDDLFRKRTGVPRGLSGQNIAGANALKRWHNHCYTTYCRRPNWESQSDAGTSNGSSGY